ncbi:MAG: GTP-binding protein, partial [Pseudomonadota bacterium]
MAVKTLLDPDARGRAGSRDALKPSRAPLSVAIVGHVDHGKSTLVGRLLHETGSLPDGKVAAVEATCRRRGMPFEWAFVTDALQAERDQGVTIDVSHMRFRTAKRAYVLVDAPGHREFLKNMISGASGSDAAFLLIDAAEGIREQSKRHGYLLHLLGIRQVAVLVNKMDRVGYDEARFTAIERDYRAYLEGLGVRPVCFVPLSARDGENIVRRTGALDWFSGPTVVDALDRMERAAPPRNLPLRMPVQDVYKFDDRRIIAGRVECGSIRVGDTVLFSPSNETARVRTIERWNAGGPV